MISFKWPYLMRVGSVVGFVATLGFHAIAADVMGTTGGQVEGTSSKDGKIRMFKGIPYAAAPIGNLRWKAPQPAPSWAGIRKATEFGSRCMQGAIYPDMIFRDKGISEDCLNLNIWTPTESGGTKIPVMVWIYGGGFAAGAASEPRQDGENLARKGVVVVNLNYRLGIFGFFSHPDLAKESSHNASGNYGLLDQTAALHWVHDNIAGFGGDPEKVTVFGESAGSFSVSALMASPLAHGLFSKAIGESGAFFSRTLAPKTLADSEDADIKFVDSALGTHSLKALRAKPAEEILQAALQQRNTIRFVPNIDGYFLPSDPQNIYKAGKQSHVPLLAGWNADEGSYRTIFPKEEATAKNFVAKAHEMFGDHADQFLKLYPASSDDEARRSAQDLAGDLFIGFGTWKWLEMQAQTGDSTVYRYKFEEAPPSKTPASGPGPGRGAYHSAEIEFVFQALDSKDLPWRPEDKKLSEIISSYWTNFAKTGNPNAQGLSSWPPYSEKTGFPVMRLGAQPYAAPDDCRARYEFLEQNPPRTNQ